MEPDAFFDFVTDMEERKKWDQRFEENKLVEEDKEENRAIVYVKTKPPPVPVIGQRDLLMTVFACKHAFGENRHVSVGQSCEHPDYPENSGWFGGGLIRAHVHLLGALVEPNPNGKGTMFTEIRFVDAKGNIPDGAIKQLSKIMGKENYHILKTQVLKIS